MNVATQQQASELNRGLVRWLVAGAAAVALFIVLLLHSAPVGAAEPTGDAIWCNGGYTTYCPNPVGGWGVGNWSGNWLANGWYANRFYGNAVNYNGFYANNVNYGFRQYTDNRSNCPDGQVTQSGGGYFCTNYGVSAFVVNNGNVGFPYLNGNFAGWNRNYGFGYTGYYPSVWNGWTGTPYTGVIRVAEATAPVQAPVAAPQPAPAAPVAAPVQAPAAPAAAVVTQPVAAPQPAPAQVVTSLAAAQQPAAPQTPLAVPTTGSANGTHVQGTATTVVAAPVVSPGNDDHRG